LLKLSGFLECGFLMERHIPAYLYLPLTWYINLLSLGVLTVPHKTPFLLEGSIFVFFSSGTHEYIQDIQISLNALLQV
jgi:hypothetical protein